MSVNDALTINRLVLNGAGICIISCYLCAPEIKAERLVHLLPELTEPAVGVHMIFPSKRELAPALRAFVGFMKEVNPPGLHWQNNELPAGCRPDRQIASATRAAIAPLDLPQ